MRWRSAAKWASYAGCLLLISVLQFTPGLLPEISSIRPMLLVPAVFCVASFEGETAGGLFGVFAGLLIDAQGARAFGFDSLFLLVFCIGAALLVQFLLRRTIVAALIVTFVFQMLLELVTWFFFGSLFGDTRFGFAFTRIILPTCLYTLPFTIPFYYGARLLYRRYLQDKDYES